MLFEERCWLVEVVMLQMWQDILDRTMPQKANIRSLTTQKDQVHLRRGSPAIDKRGLFYDRCCSDRTELVPSKASHSLEHTPWVTLLAALNFYTLPWKDMSSTDMPLTTHTMIFTLTYSGMLYVDEICSNLRGSKVGRTQSRRQQPRTKRVHRRRGHIFLQVQLRSFILRWRG